MDNVAIVSRHHRSYFTFHTKARGIEDAVNNGLRLRGMVGSILTTDCEQVAHGFQKRLSRQLSNASSHSTVLVCALSS